MTENKLYAKRNWCVKVLEVLEKSLVSTQAIISNLNVGNSLPEITSYYKNIENKLKMKISQIRTEAKAVNKQIYELEESEKKKEPEQMVVI